MRAWTLPLGVIAALVMGAPAPGLAQGLSPDEAVMTRRDFLQALYPMVKRLESQGAIARSTRPSIVVFADLEGRDRDWAIELASQFHLFAGLPALTSGRFNGMLPLSRWEAALILGELLGRTRPEARSLLKGASAPEAFADLSAAEARRLEPVVGPGLLIGYPDRTFRTQEPLTRGQWAIVSGQLAAFGAYRAPVPTPRPRKDDFLLIRQGADH